MKMTEPAEELIREAKTRGDCEVCVETHSTFRGERVTKYAPIAFRIEDIRQDIGGDFKWRSLVFSPDI